MRIYRTIYRNIRFFALLLILNTVSSFAQEAVQENRTGTVKTGDYSTLWQPSWSAVDQQTIIVNQVLALIILLAILLIVCLLAAIWRISQATQGKSIKIRNKKLRHRFRFKLVLSAVALQIITMAVVLIPLLYLEILWADIITLIVFASLAIGIIAAVIFSSLLTRPVRKLVNHAEMIRSTDKMEDLAGMEISIAGNDEIAVLAGIINGIRQRLVKAAEAASNISIGKELQKKFLPLEMDSSGNKLNSGLMDTKNAVFFGYYDGAAGLSGDYFDYKDLDGRYYAIIKCDVAGKGIPAALLMIQVATMFINYFKNWKLSVSGMHIEEVVYQINSFIESMGFKGRFAAFALCLFDSETGDLHFCNAGDNLIHICDTSEKRIKSITLPASPAAGAVPNNMVMEKGGYQVQTITLDHGDILLLYTDGIEEAQQQGESMGRQRVYAIVNAVLNRQTYSLHKEQAPEEESLDFDFSGCDGSVEDVIMGLICIEKIFRCSRDPGFTDADSVLVDK